MSEMAEKRTCHWKFDTGGRMERCPNESVRIMDWGDGKWSRFCEYHWDVRERMRPATRQYHEAAIRGALAILHGEKRADEVLAELDSIKGRR